MKNTITALITFTGAAVLAVSPALRAETHKPAAAPVVITPPAVHSGSNWSRAPFIAARSNDDVLPPNGEAVDQDVPPNTPSTTPDPLPPPVAAVAIGQPRVEPGLMPTGQATVGASAAADSLHVDPMIRNAPFESRDEVVDNVRLRTRQSEVAVLELRRTEPQMSSTGRGQFATLNDEVKERRKALEKSTRAAANASASDWESARAQLATDYDAYAAALAQMDAAAGIRPAVQR